MPCETETLTVDDRTPGMGGELNNGRVPESVPFGQTRARNHTQSHGVTLKAE
jgi:hypothetical protein